VGSLAAALALAGVAPASARAAAIGASTIAPAQPAVTKADLADATVFPIPGPHDYGTWVNHFGGGRDHKGQDVLAPCGLPVLAMRGGRVHDARYDAAGGDYAVIDAADGTSQVYMHLLEPSGLHAGAKVAAGARVGRVGQTGRASTCHLHFELWTAPGWYAGGHAIDPLATLRRWDAAT
jgi:murein DD-endopeptidase MepM/ murein hydrolase activator NlpD